MIADNPRSGFISTSKMLGDAGEHYALSQFTFAGKPAAKMPENWTDYDLAVATDEGLLRVSVKTRSETKGWKTSNWFNFDERKKCDWLVLIFRPQCEPIKSWIIPFDVARDNANQPGEKRKDPWFRDIMFWKLQEAPLAQYENNWPLAVK